MNKNPLEIDLKLNVATIVTIASLLATIQAVAYQFLFLKYLGVKWYFNVLDTQQILMSTLSIIIINFSCMFLGYYLSVLSKGLNGLRMTLNIIINLLIIANIIIKVIPSEISGLIVITTLSYLLKNIYEKGDEHKNIQSKDTNKKEKFVSTITTTLKITMIAITLTGYITTIDRQARTRAKNIRTNFQNICPEVKFENEIWYLVKTTGNEALLIKEENKKVIFRIKALREINQISDTQ